MTGEQSKTINQTLGDPRLQLAIYSATNRLMTHRAGAIHEDLLPDYQDLRTAEVPVAFYKDREGRFLRVNRELSLHLRAVTAADL